MRKAAKPEHQPTDDPADRPTRTFGYAREH